VSQSNPSALAQYGPTGATKRSQANSEEREKESQGDKEAVADAAPAFVFDDALGTTLVAALGKLFSTLSISFLVFFFCFFCFCLFVLLVVSFFFLLSFLFLASPSSCSFPDPSGWLRNGYSSVARTWISSLVCYSTRLLTIILTSDHTGTEKKFIVLCFVFCFYVL
jgi:hypothetical protein